MPYFPHHDPHHSFSNVNATFNLRPTMSFSLPGLGLSDDPSPSDPSTQSTQTTTHTLPATSEWRFEIAPEKTVQLKLLTGTAELFGTEIVVSATPYFLTGMKGAVFTWTGCTFEVVSDAGAGSGGLQSEYTAEEAGAGMKEVVNLHFALEALRDAARMAQRPGPRVLILGPRNAGKTSLAKMLVAYAIRSGRAPVVSNLDAMGEGVLSLPGTLSAGVFKSLVDVEEGWGSAPMSGPSGSVPVKMPLVYYFGVEGVEQGEKALRVYMGLVRRLALAVQGRLQGDVEARGAGLVIDTPGVLGGGNWEVVQHVISEFAVNCVVCVGSERLYSEAAKRFDGKPSSSSYWGDGEGEMIQVVKLAKSGGCVDRDEAFMQARRAAQIKTYFYGAPKGTAGVSLSPRQQHVDFNTLSVYRVVGARSLGGGDVDDDEGFLPGGADQDYDTTGEETSKVQLPATQLLETITTPHPAMQNALLTIMNCEPDAPEEEIRYASVMGFLYVTDVDVSRERLGVLSPVAGRVPNRAIVWGEWPEGVLGMVGW